jgi:glucokinase
MRKLLELVESGDQAATEAVRETARYLGIGITGLINGLDPEVVVIGGEITKAPTVSLSGVRHSRCDQV